MKHFIDNVFIKNFLWNFKNKSDSILICFSTSTTMTWQKWFRIPKFLRKSRSKICGKYSKTFQKRFQICSFINIYFVSLLLSYYFSLLRNHKKQQKHLLWFLFTLHIHFLTFTKKLSVTIIFILWIKYLFIDPSVYIWEFYLAIRNLPISPNLCSVRKLKRSCGSFGLDFFKRKLTFKIKKY